MPEEKGKKWYNQIESTIGVIIMIALLVLLTIQVFSRYFAGVSFAWIDEISRYGLIWLAYFAAVYAIFTDSHIKVELLLKVWPKKIRPAIRHISVFIFLIYSIVVAIYSTMWVLDVFRTGSTSMALHVPMVVFQCVIPITHYLMAIRLIQVEIRYIKHPEILRDKTAEEEAEELLKNNSDGSNKGGEE